MRTILLFVAVFSTLFAYTVPASVPTIKLFSLIDGRLQSNSALDTKATNAPMDIQAVAKMPDQIETKPKKDNFVVIEASEDPKVGEYAKRLNAHQADYYNRVKKHKDSYFGAISKRDLLTE